MTTAVRTRPAHRGAPGRRHIVGWIYAAPTALFVLGLFIVPLVLVLQMSGSDWPLLRGNQGWNFPQNFVDAFQHRLFWDAVGFTVLYALIVTVVLLSLGLGLALLVQEATRWKSLLRTALLVPSALGLASAALLFYVLYSPQAGPFAWLMEITGTTFLGTPTGALFSTVFLMVWRFTGFYMLLMLVGLNGIPEEVYEAGRIDGATRWQSFRYITLPLMRPTIALCLVLSITGGLLAFEQFYILTAGGPDNSTLTIVQLIYGVAFRGQNDLGLAGALSVIALLALVAINVAQLRAFRRPREN